MTTTVYYTKLHEELFDNDKLVKLPAGWYQREINSNGDAEMKLMSTDPVRKDFQSSKVTWWVRPDIPESYPVKFKPLIERLGQFLQ